MRKSPPSSTPAEKTLPVLSASSFATTAMGLLQILDRAPPVIEPSSTLVSAQSIIQKDLDERSKALFLLRDATKLYLDYLIKEVPLSSWNRDNSKVYHDADSMIRVSLKDRLNYGYLIDVSVNDKHIISYANGNVEYSQLNQLMKLVPNESKEP
jgi:hypothetical protein